MSMPDGLTGNDGNDLGVETIIVSVSSLLAVSSWLHRPKKQQQRRGGCVGFARETTRRTRHTRQKSGGFPLLSVYVRIFAHTHLSRPDKYKYMPVAPAARPLPAEARSLPIPLLIFRPAVRCGAGFVQCCLGCRFPLSFFCSFSMPARRQVHRW